MNAVKVRRHGFAVIVLLGLLLMSTLGSRAAPLPPAKIVLGDEVFLQDAWHELRGRCIGIVTNQTGVTSQLQSIVDAVRAHGQICLKAIFSPEHGLRGDQPAGTYVASYTDVRSGLPVYSLYGASRHPTAEMLAGIDVMLVDLQDVGDRAYTYISTMAYVMESAKEHNKEVWVLDRPNPIGGDVVEGPVLDSRFKSFIGLFPIALRHGMTVGELAQMFNERFGIGCNLRIIAMRKYRREMLWPDTGLTWVQTSPNIPDWETTLFYPATGLIDEAGINNGVGSTKPFRLAGTAKLDGYRLADYLNARSIPGAYFRPTAWMPSFGFWKDKTLTGVELVVTDQRSFRPVRTAVELLVAVRKLEPAAIAVHKPKSLDHDWGTDTLRLHLIDGMSVDEIMRPWQAKLAEFETVRAKYLLYP